MVVELAGTVLPCGEPALAVLDRFSMAEIAQLRDAMNAMDSSEWYYKLTDRHSSKITVKP